LRRWAALRYGLENSDGSTCRCLVACRAVDPDGAGGGLASRIAGGFAGSSVSGFAKKEAPPKEDYYELFRVLADTLDQVERNYVKPVDRRN